MAEPIVSHTEWDRFSWPRIQAKLDGTWKRASGPSLLVEQAVLGEWEQKKARLRAGECWNGYGHGSLVAGQRFCKPCMTVVSEGKRAKRVAK
jgi:hypothetical protein